jgi:hypothetical protein
MRFSRNQIIGGLVILAVIVIGSLLRWLCRS